MIELFISALVTFFVVIDPPGCAPIFASLTADAPKQQRHAMALRSVFIAGIILFAFALFGKGFLETLGISLDAFRIAGGAMLFLIALEMVFEKRTQRREQRAEAVARDSESSENNWEDISVFPMAIPMLAGPGSIASAMLLVSQSPDWSERIVILGAMVSVLIVTAITLVAAPTLLRILGPRLEATITRILGVILAALATQFVIDGLRGSFGI